MQPIPITPAPVDGSAGATFFIVVAFSLAALFVAATLIVLFLRGKNSTILPVSAGLALLLALSALMGLTTQPFAERSGESQALIDAAIAQNSAVRSNIQKDYGLKLNSTEAGSLEYPEKAPKEDFKIYGQLQSVGKGSQLQLPSDSVYLIWKGGSLQLAEGSGKSFTEIESKG